MERNKPWMWSLEEKDDMLEVPIKEEEEDEKVAKNISTTQL